jgi:hypothetical protein
MKTERFVGLGAFLFFLRKLIAPLLLTAIRSLASGATCSAASPTSEALSVSRATMPTAPSSPKYLLHTHSPDPEDRFP